MTSKEEESTTQQESTMERRPSLLLVLLVALLLLLLGQARPTLADVTLRGLKYRFDALEPYIDKGSRTAILSRHHRTYTDKTNQALKELRSDASISSRLRKAVEEEDIETAQALAQEEANPKPAVLQLRNSGGGFLNHNEYFDLLRPRSEGGGEEPALDSKLKGALVKTFGSVDKFREQFEYDAVNKVFGSGWAWLVVDRDHGGQLKIVTTQNQDRPSNAYPIIGCDLWEHAMYLKYQNRKNEYMKAFWGVLDFKVAEERYLHALEREQHCKEDEKEACKHA